MWLLFILIFFFHIIHPSLLCWLIGWKFCSRLLISFQSYTNFFFIWTELAVNTGSVSLLSFSFSSVLAINAVPIYKLTPRLYETIGCKCCTCLQIYIQASYFYWAVCKCRFYLQRYIQTLFSFSWMCTKNYAIDAFMKL